uniref:NADH dehydrogenase [ubiquinone] 1 alpha subcomplex subunit 10, mitochondrial n=2 Tax=Hirondellea gigas TaxID=1518452 RepID=A0A6A7FQ76_9CRUS
MAGTVSAVVATVRQRGIVSLARCSLPLLSGAKTFDLSQIEQRRGIVSKSMRLPDYKRKAPFPYTEKRYNLWRAIFDDTTQRFDENSKILVVDGPPSGNKAKLAMGIAEELDMMYMPGANLDERYINKYGYDLRSVNDQLPPNVRCFDINDFLRDPNHWLVAKMQFELMRIRFGQYLDALSHVLNTGQGVVMNRSIYSEGVFVDTMAEHGFITKKAQSFYFETLEQGDYEFMRPHLVIYLDIPVQQVLKNIKDRNRPEEVNSPFYTAKVLASLEKNYKEKYLRKMAKHAEVLVYNWKEEGDPEVVVEDIERINFDKYTDYDLKLEDWRFDKEWDWKYKRIMFSQYREHLLSDLILPKLNVPELVATADEVMTFYDVYENKVPGNKYLHGFNKDLGDSYLFKLKSDSLIK